MWRDSAWSWVHTRVTAASAMRAWGQCCSARYCGMTGKPQCCMCAGSYPLNMADHEYGWPLPSDMPMMPSFMMLLPAGGVDQVDIGAVDLGRQLQVIRRLHGKDFTKLIRRLDTDDDAIYGLNGHDVLQASLEGREPASRQPAAP